MKVPVRPPSHWNILNQLTPDRLTALLQKVSEPTVDGKYLHWDELRHRPSPDGIASEEWWAALKLRRIGQEKSTPLRDAHAMLEFSFNLVDPLPEQLHRIDLSAGGSLQLPEQVTNPEMRNGSLVRSLMEEAITSSQLEGAATTREVAKEMIRQGRPARDRSEQMILNNYKAMQRIIAIKDEPLTRNLIDELHRIVTEQALDDLTAVGRSRRPDETVVVGDDLGEIYHVPPPADQLEDRLAALIAFANVETPGSFIHPVVRSMILHFWLAYDHPFVDGNGRTARALFYWSMLRHRYWLFEFISISRIIRKAPIQYGRAFLHTETDANDLTYFLVYHVGVIGQAITELYEYLERRTGQLRALEAELRGMLMLNHRQRDLISHALRHPGYRYRIDSHQGSHGVVYQTARTDLLDLAERGLLEKLKVGNAWVFIPVADLEQKLRPPR